MSYNSTVLSDTECPERDTRRPDAPFYHWLVLGYVFLFVLALSANLHVLFKLFHYSRRRFRDHILLLNLCAADLFVTLVYIPSEIYAFSVGRWHNDGICKAIAALKGLGIYVSSCTIIGISVDRYLSIVHPLTVYQSNTRNKLFVAGSWLVSAIACIPQVRKTHASLAGCSSNVFFGPLVDHIRTYHRSSSLPRNVWRHAVIRSDQARDLQYCCGDLRLHRAVDRHLLFILSYSICATKTMRSSRLSLC